MDGKAICVRCGKSSDHTRAGLSGPLCPRHYWTPPEVECAITELRVLDVWTPSYGMVSGGIYVLQKTDAHTGDRRFAVTLRDHWYLDKTGKWTNSHEASHETRWESREEAVQAATKAAYRLIEEEGKVALDV